MSESHSVLTLRVPPRCPVCDAQDRVKIETEMNGDAVVLRWRCAKCDHHWPVPPPI